MSAKLLCMRMAYVKRPSCALTKQDALDLIAPMNVHDILLRCGEVALVGRSVDGTCFNFITHAGNVNLWLGINDVASPRYPVYSPAANTEAHKKLEEYVTYLLEVCKEYKVVVNCCDMIFTRCKTPQEARWVWPSIRLLAQSGLSVGIPYYQEDLKEILLATENKEVPKSSANFSREEREMFRMASQYITAASCLEPIAPEHELKQRLIYDGGDVGIRIEAFSNTLDYLNPFTW